MNLQSKKKLQNFKKEIKKEVVDRKKFQMRRQLPFYKEMFRQIDESSNATNSRSSRFPIRVCLSKQRSNVFEIYPQVEINNTESHEQEQQIRYLQYLKSINTIFSEQDKALVENWMTKRYGQNCFSDIGMLRQKICCDLLIYEKVLYQDGEQDRLDGIRKIAQDDWYFVVASLKFAQNERLEEIQRISFGLITGLFNQWYYQQLIQLIDHYQHNSFNTIFAKMLNLADIQIRLQQPILSKLLLLAHNTRNLLQPSSLKAITHYMTDKLIMFQLIQKRMLEIFEVEETENFSQMAFNYGFAHGVVVMIQCLDKVDAEDIEIRMGIHSLVSKYYAMYPVNVNTQTEGKFNAFINSYLNNLNTFCNQISYLANATPIIPNSPLFSFLSSTQSLIHSILWKDSLDDNSNYTILSIYSYLITISLNCDGLISKLNEFSDFHRKMIQFALTFYSFFQGSRQFFGRNEYVHYVSLLIMGLHEIKLIVKNQNYYFMQHTSTISHVDNSLKQQLSNLQYNLIYALYIIHDNQVNEQCQQISNDVAKLLEYTEFIYRTEQKTLEEIRSFQNLQNINLIFEDNVKLYFRVLLNQTQKHISQPDSEQHYQESHFQGEVQI